MKFREVAAPLLLATNALFASRALPAAALGWYGRASRFVHAFFPSGGAMSAGTTRQRMNGRGASDMSAIRASTFSRHYVDASGAGRMKGLDVSLFLLPPPHPLDRLVVLPHFIPPAASGGIPRLWAARRAGQVTLRERHPVVPKWAL